MLPNVLDTPYHLCKQDFCTNHNHTACTAKSDDSEHSRCPHSLKLLPARFSETLEGSTLLLYSGPQRSLPRFWVSIRSYKKQPVKKNWGRILGLAWLKFAVAPLGYVPAILGNSCAFIALFFFLMLF